MKIVNQIKLLFNRLKFTWFCILIYVSFLSGMTLAGPGDDDFIFNFNGAFSRKIYEQKDLIEDSKKRGLTEEETDKILLLNLYKEKTLAVVDSSHKYLVRKCETYQKVINNIKDEIIQKNRTQRLKEVIAGIDNAKNAVQSGVGLMLSLSIANFNPILGAIGGISLTVADIISGFMPLALKICDDETPEIRSLRKDIDELNLKMEQQLEALQREPIRDLEEWYIKDKRKLPDERQNVLEDALLNARNKDLYFSIMSRQRITSLLKLPHQHQKIINGDYNEAREELLQRFAEHPFFNILDKNLKSDLEKIIIKLVDASLSKDDTGVNKKKCFYWSGNPSCGKSETADELAKFLGLPAFSKSIIDVSQVGSESIYGADWFRPTVASLGWLGQTLLEGSKNGGRAVTNSILILEDFDRILENPNGPAYNFLLNLLDPKTKQFVSPYFEIPIDISRLVIVITANKDLPKDKVWDALRSRVRETRFPDLTGVQENHILTRYFNNSLLKYCRIASAFKATCTQNKITLHTPPEEMEKLGLASVLKLEIPLPKQDPVELRKKKDFLEEVLQDFHRSKYLQSKSYYERTRDPKVLLEDKRSILKQVALLGRSEAAFELGSECEINNQINIAINWYKIATAQGHKAAIDRLAKMAKPFELGSEYEHKNQLNLAIRWYQIGKSLGDKASIDKLAKLDKPFELAFEYENKNQPVLAERWYEFAEKKDHEEAIFALARLSHRRKGNSPEDQRRYNAVVQRTDFTNVTNPNHIRAFKEICHKQGNFHQEEQLRRLLTRMLEKSFSFKVLKKDQTKYSDIGCPLQNLFAPSQLDISNLAEDLKHTSALTSFTIYYRDLGDEAIKSLCRVLKNNNSLTSIKLSFSYITNNGIAMLGEALEGKTQLRDLTMEDICPRFDKQSIINLSKKLSNVRLNTPHGEYNF